MTYLIIATVAFASVYFCTAFICHCADSINRRRNTNSIAAIVSPLEITSTIKPMNFGGGVELAVTIPTKIRDLKKFVRTHSLQKTVKQYTGKSYGSLNLAQLSEAVGVAIAT